MGASEQVAWRGLVWAPIAAEGALAGPQREEAGGKILLLPGEKLVHLHGQERT